MIFDIVIVMIQYYISSYITLHSITLHSIWCTVYLALYNITLSYDDDIVYCSNFWIPPISTSESLIFMESSSKMNHFNVATRKDPCCHGSFSTCTSNSVWLTSVTIWVAVWQAGNLGEKWKTWVQKRWGNNLNPRSTMMHTQMTGSLPSVVFEPHLFRFQSTAKLIWIPGTNSTLTTCKPGISSDSQWFEAFLKSKSTLPKTKIAPGSVDHEKRNLDWSVPQKWWTNL